jgi:hypothetical protein
MKGETGCEGSPVWIEKTTPLYESYTGIFNNVSNEHSILTSLRDHPRLLGIPALAWKFQHGFGGLRLCS